jgi:hypothetical protein
MAASTTLRATEYTKVYNVINRLGSAEQFANANQRKLRGMYDVFSHATVAYDAGSEIGFGLLPKGCRVLGWMVSWEAQGAAITADFEIGGVTASTSECITDMTSDGAIGFIPALPVFQKTPLTADSILTIVTAAQATGIGDKIMITTVYLDED